ncbi:hypothetical protein [Paenibacillus antarcticus]|nr:hypothetical protein [Paenibacillus antarcticus]
MSGGRTRSLWRGDHIIIINDEHCIISVPFNTSVKMLIGMEQRSSGDVYILGTLMPKLNILQQIRYMAQSDGTRPTPLTPTYVPYSYTAVLGYSPVFSSFRKF